MASMQALIWSALVEFLEPCLEAQPGIGNKEEAEEVHFSFDNGDPAAVGFDDWLGIRRLVNNCAFHVWRKGE
jgi:hypothetical protein